MASPLKPSYYLPSASAFYRCREITDSLPTRDAIDILRRARHAVPWLDFDVANTWLLRAMEHLQNDLEGYFRGIIT